MKKLIQRIGATVLIGSVLAFAANAAESPSVLLQKGIYTEETEGNVDAAIKIYQQIATDFTTSRAVVAQAQYRLAVCYQKKGSKEQSIHTLNDLLQQFPADADMSKKARTLLRELGQAAAEALTMRKVPLAVASIWDVSPDDRLITYKGTRNNDTYVGELATGKNWVVAKGTDSGDFPWNGARFSPDAGRLAYDMSGAAIFTVKTDGTDTRQVFKSASDKVTPYYGVEAWSIDGKRLITSCFDPLAKIFTLLSIDAETGSAQEILTRADVRQTSGVVLSHSGRYFAYNVESDQRCKIFVTDLTTRTENLIVDKEPGELLGWSPDDSQLIFGSERRGTRDSWAIALKDGKAAGQPELLKALAPGMLNCFIAHSGNVYYTQAKETSNVYVGAFDFRTGAVTTPPRIVVDRFPGMQSTPSWSKDGEKLLIAIRGDQRRFLTHAMTTAEEQELPWAQAVAAVGQYSWSGQGNSIVALVAAKEADHQQGLQRYDLSSGKVEMLIPRRQDGMNWVGQPAVAPDGDSFFYIDREGFKAPDKTDDWTDRVVRRDLGSGKEETIYGPKEKLDVWCSLAVTRDGSRLAFANSDEFKVRDFVVSIKVVDLKSREIKEVIRLAPQQQVRSLAWTPDGTRLVYRRTAGSKSTPPQAGIWSTAVDSGESVRLEIREKGIGNIAIHPDGRQIAFSAGSTGRELWVMEGLLPSSGAATAGATKN